MQPYQRAFQGCVPTQMVWTEAHLTLCPSLSCLTDSGSNILPGSERTREEEATLVHHTSVSEDYFIAIRNKLDGGIPKGLINKTWLHVGAHFGCRENRAKRSLKPTLFNIKEMNINRSTTHRSARQRAFRQSQWPKSEEERRPRGISAGKASRPSLETRLSLAPSCVGLSSSTKWLFLISRCLTNGIQWSHMYFCSYY